MTLRLPPLQPAKGGLSRRLAAGPLARNSGTDVPLTEGYQ